MMESYIKMLQKISHDRNYQKPTNQLIKINEPTRSVLDSISNHLTHVGFRIPMGQLVLVNSIFTLNYLKDINPNTLLAENEKLRKEIARLKDQLVMADSRNIMLMRDNRILISRK